MHWSDQIAMQLIKNKPQKEEFVLAAGISPSGTVHIGNFRDVATIYFVAKALIRKGKKAKLLFSWDEYDRFRKVPKNIPENLIEQFETYLGKPYTEVPDPLGCHSSYAEHYELEFEESLAKVGMKFNVIRYQAKEYKSGRYRDGVLTALKKRREIYDILQSFKTQESSNQEREEYFPISIYCDSCDKDNTKVTGISDDYTEINYKCSCGHTAKINIYKQSNFKLPWKIDWAMRWMYENVDFEPAGKDHAAPQGSYQVSKVISKKIYGFDEPLFQGYEFIGIRGLTGKMSGSSGININLGELLKIYSPEIIWWMFAKKPPNEAFDISLGDDVPRIYGEFDKIYDKYFNDRNNLDEITIQIMDMVLEDRNKSIRNVPFGILSTLYSISNTKIEIIEEMFNKIGMDYKAQDLSDRLAKVSYWLKKYSPDTIIKLRTSPDFEFFNSLDEEVKSWVASFCNVLKNDFNAEELMTHLYAIPRKITLDDKMNKKNQLLFFKTMYKLLIGKEKGPMLSTLVLALGAENVLPIIEPLV